MKFSIGDKILLKRTGEEGHIVSLLSPGMLEVDVNGTSFPVYEDEVDHPYLKWFTEKKKDQKKQVSPPEQLPVEKIKLRPQKPPQGIYLSFLPVFRMSEMEDIVDHLKIYLLNETGHTVHYSYDVRVTDKSVFSLEGTLHPFGHLYLHKIDYADMNDQPRFHWELSTVNDANKLSTEEGVLRIRPAKLFAHVSDLLQKNEPSFNYMLIEDFRPAPPAKNEDVKKGVPLPQQAKEKPRIIRSFHQLELPRYELDLHIEQLGEHTTGLNNTEILQLQLSTLQHYLYLAIAHQQDRMIVIHGMGKGILRDAIHKVLKQVPEVSRFVNEFHGRYGFGATEIFFSYKK
ncbi:Smr/MutS family protein [Chitinophagaceae bacterium MMS25-I14]